MVDGLYKEEKLQHQENNNIDYMMRIHDRIEKTVDDPKTAEALKPWYMFMCKRPCFHNDYLPTFNRTNVHLIDTHGEGITKITQRGPEFKGKEYELDLLIFATGFEVQKTGIYNQIVGKNNLDLEDKYRDGIRTLLGIHTEGFPNLFIMGGYQASFQFLIDFSLTMDYYFLIYFNRFNALDLEVIDWRFVKKANSFILKNRT